MAKKRNLLPWLSVGTERRSIQIGNKFLHNEKFKSLKYSSRCLYLFLAMESGGKAEMEFSHGMAKKYGVKESTFDNAIDELIRKGFIIRVQSNDMSQFAKAKFKFCYDWKIDSS